MKAKIADNMPTILTLIPETDDERTQLVAYARRMARPCMISARGFLYMDPSVEFYIQPMPSGD